MVHTDSMAHTAEAQLRLLSGHEGPPLYNYNKLLILREERIFLEHFGDKQGRKYENFIGQLAVNK